MFPRFLALLCVTSTLLHSEVPAALQTMADAARQSLVRLDKSVGEAAADAGPFLEASNERMLRAILQRVVRSNTMAVDAAIVSPRGQMQWIEPPAFKKFEGTDLSTQKSWRSLSQTRLPVVSQAFRMAEGFYAISLAHPVFFGTSWKGSVSVAFRPSTWIEESRDGPLRGLPFRFFAVQKDGLILASSDPGFVGGNLRKETSGTPAAMQSLSSRILGEPAGHGEYTSPAAEDEMRTQVAWTTVALRGAEFRLALTSDFSGAVPRGSVDPEAVRKALDRLADSPAFVKALRGETREAETAMLTFLYRVKGVYSVQLLDVGGKIVCGQPMQSVPVGMDTAAGTAPSGLKGGLAGKKPASYEAPLLEGGTGCFLVQPLPRGIGSLVAIIRYE